MTILTQQDHLPVGAIFHNTLSLPDGTIIGILLGHCVFGTDGNVKAKYFNNTLYTLEGQILAIEKKTYAAERLTSKMVAETNAWEFIRNIKDHTSPLVDPTETWADVILKDYFL